ncbi:uncharacterized protein LY89DRAFT_467734 [Mollisia scopiformis]|uniref:Uncharacterized protein n=1 Tax=Mollisia scopiformis TaxID=149040 RepID=A0A194XIN3_MOLSC|nr:uncharacterized protein LY89DRAFT_467734 [Mollisia scopiformis]KUJ19979.1 hypothetical protein LY89DRAFT_467734 [Mollisia scopiformis]
MPERRQATSSTSSTSRPTTGVRRNLFHQHLSRRPTTSSTSTSTETLRLDIEPESDSSEIVIRDKNGEFEIGDLPMTSFDDEHEEGVDTQEEESEHTRSDMDGWEADTGIEERQRLADAVKHHQRDRNRAPSEPAELLDAVKASLRAKMALLAEDNWMYEAEDDHSMR